MTKSTTTTQQQEGTTTPAARGADRRPVVVAVVVALAVLLVHLWSIPGQALTDDDDFYVPAGLRYAQWVGDVVRSPGHALTRAGIDAAFVVNHEHPPLAKFVFGAAHAVFTDGLGVLGTLDGARAGNAVFAAALAAALVLWTWRALGPLASLMGVALLLSLPRFFLHQEVATLDAPVATMVVLFTVLFSATTDPRDDRLGRAVVVGIVFGLGCLTKLNAPFALVPCAAFAVLQRWRAFAVERGAGPDARPQLRLPTPPWSLLACAALGPVVFVVGWPWLWHDTAARFAAWVAFHLKHYPILLFFDGEIWERPFAPGRAAVVHAFGSMPLVVVVLGAVGAVAGAGALIRVARQADDDGAASARKDRVLGLALLQAAMSLGVVALADVPRYGGEKLFLPFFPFWAVLAGHGVAVVVEGLADVLAVPGRAGASGVRRPLVVAVVVVAALLPGVVGHARFAGGYALSFSGGLVGGLRGAVARGHERTYYDMADKALARRLDDVARGRRVHVAPNHKEYVRTFRWLRHDGVIARDGFTLVDQRRQADVVVLTHERRWSTYPALRDELRGWKVLGEKRIDGVPLWTILERP